MLNCLGWDWIYNPLAVDSQSAGVTGMYTTSGSLCVLLNLPSAIPSPVMMLITTARNSWECSMNKTAVGQRWAPHLRVVGSLRGLSSLKWTVTVDVFQDHHDWVLFLSPQSSLARWKGLWSGLLGHQLLCGKHCAHLLSSHARDTPHLSYSAVALPQQDSKGTEALPRLTQAIWALASRGPWGKSCSGKMN